MTGCTGTRFLVPLTLVVGSALGAGIAWIAIDDSETSRQTPAETSAEVGFVRDMSSHHAQAVEMADIIRTRTEDPLLSALATDIVLTQQAQIGRFHGWLEQWGLPPTSLDAPMAWAGEHSAMDMGSMPGMATRNDISKLDDLPVTQAETLFLSLMIRHHLGGVEMADSVLTMTQRDDVRRIAESIVASQQFEIEAMQSMLYEGRSAPPP